MKIYIFLFLYMLSLSCARKTLVSNSVEYVSSTDATLSVNIVGVGKSRKEAIDDAEKKIFEIVLFRGLPDSDHKMALVGYSESEMKLKHQEYFDSFFNKGRFKSFLISSTIVSDLMKSSADKQSITMSIKLNVSALKKDLEYNNVIRKFGY